MKQERYEVRTYRSRLRPRGLVPFQVAVKETDLWISTDRDLEKESLDLVLEYRRQLEDYIRANPFFRTSLRPLPPDPFAPPLVREMMEAAWLTRVGPMATVAGAIAERVGRGLLECSREVIVENGGDIFLKADRTVTVSLFAGDSPLSGRVGILISTDQMPLGVCTSSGRVGHSLSMGRVHAACVLASSAALADGAATACANRIRTKGDLERTAGAAKEIPGLKGGVFILDDHMATWGNVRLVDL